MTFCQDRTRCRYVVTFHETSLPPYPDLIGHNPRLLPCRGMPIRQPLHRLGLYADVFHPAGRDLVAQDADSRLVILLQRRVKGQRDLLGLAELPAVLGI